MKELCKRSLALLMVLVMLVGLLPAITVQTDAAGYVYNWGEREEVATELSDMAVQWYTNKKTSYAALSQLSGSSNQNSVPSSTLYQKLKTLMTDAHSYKTSYEATKELYRYTDCQNGGGSISSFYSGKSIGPAWGQGSWNREHTWPNSKGLGGQDENDIMMLRPTSTSENSSRGNTAYGKSSGYYNPNSESGGKYDLRGDCARIVLYVYVRWGNTSKMWGSNGVMESKSVLLEWMEEDPVDTWELGRNDAVQSITGTRNVFVDYPELGFLLFNAEIPDDYQSPSGEGASVSYKITATSNNTAYGTVSLNDKTITASPKTGYYASGYTVTSGSATVTQDGNTFTVSPTSDCTVRINFAAKKTITVSFSGANVKSNTGYAGESMTLPTVTAPEGYTFLGWMASELSTDTTTKPSYYTNSFTPTASMTLYALYSYVDESGSGGSGDYVKVTSAPSDWSGEYVIVYEDKGYIFNGSLSSFDATNNYKSVTIQNNTIPASQADAYKFTIAPVSGGYSIQGTSGGYIGHGSNANGLTTGNSALKNTISVDGSGIVNIIGSGGAYLRFNKQDGQNRFRYYKTSSYSGQQPIALYVKDGSAGITYYTSQAGCSHNEELCREVLPTLTQDGYMQLYCADCGEELNKEDYTAAYDLHWNMTLQEDMVVKFKINVYEALTDQMQILVGFDGKTETYTAANGVCNVSINVAAAQVADSITVKFVLGEESVTNTYSVKKYADELLADAKQSQYHSLAQAMLNYCGAAQVYFDNYTGDPVSTQYGENAVPATAEKELTVTGSAQEIRFYGASLVYREKIAVRFYFTGDAAGKVFTANGKTYTAGEKNGLYYVEISDILPQNLNEQITVTVDSLTVAYSPMNYIVRMNKKDDAKLQNLLKALYNYHLAAKEYVAAYC